MNRQPPEDVIDLVCGMTVNPTTAVDEFIYKGTSYYFCAPVCREKFEAHPELYLPDQANDQ